MADRMKGKVVLVTGASSGIGRATALRMAEEGADLALVARGKDKLEAVAAEARATGTQVLTHAVDVGDFDAYVAAIEATARHFRRIDAIVNNAMHEDRKRVGQGKRVSVRVDLGGRRIIKKKKRK